MKKENGVSTLIGIIIIVLAAAIIFGGVYVYQNFFISNGEIKIDQTAGWKTYTNSQYGFEFKYPENFFDTNQQPKLLIGDCNYGVFPSQCPNINNLVAQDMAVDGGDLSAIESNLSNPGYWDDPNGAKQTINNINYCLYTTGDRLQVRGL